MSKIEGYWRQTIESWENLPFPVERLDPIINQDTFLKALTSKEKQAKVHNYKGISLCRICRKMNGSREFELNGWRWPEGFRHYIEFHNILPSEDFIEFILD